MHLLLTTCAYVCIILICVCFALPSGTHVSCVDVSSVGIVYNICIFRVYVVVVYTAVVTCALSYGYMMIFLQPGVSGEYAEADTCYILHIQWVRIIVSMWDCDMCPQHVHEMKT